eukprot:755098-Hanusia_phi.AAC.1
MVGRAPWLMVAVMAMSLAGGTEVEMATKGDVRYTNMPSACSSFACCSRVQEEVLDSSLLLSEGRKAFVQGGGLR